MSVSFLIISSTGAPIILSLPHFFQGDEKYKNAFVGLNPNLEEHQTFFDLEPVSSSIFSFKNLQRYKDFEFSS